MQSLETAAKLLDETRTRLWKETHDKTKDVKIHHTAMTCLAATISELDWYLEGNNTKPEEEVTKRHDLFWKRREMTLEEMDITKITTKINILDWLRKPADAVTKIPMTVAPEIMTEANKERKEVV